MANITVSQNCYWGGPEYSWSGLVYGDTVTINGVVLTVDSSVYIPTGALVGVNVENSSGFSMLKIVNSDSLSATVLCGKSGGALNVKNGSSLQVLGGRRILKNSSGSDWVSDGSSGQVLSSSTLGGWTGAGFDAKDHPSVIEVEESSGNWFKWVVIRKGIDSLNDIGVGAYLGRFCLYDDTTGNIEFGNAGAPVALAQNATVGQSSFTLADASQFSVGNVIHIFDGTNCERFTINGKNGNVITVSNYFTIFNFSSSNSFCRFTKGGNIPPNGARVRVYNVGIATVNSSSVRLVSSATDTDDFMIDTANNGIVDISNCYMFGVRTNFVNTIDLSLRNFAAFRRLYIENAIVPTLDFITLAPDYYITTKRYGFQVSAMGLKFTNSIFVNSNTRYYAFYIFGSISNGALFEDCHIQGIKFSEDAWDATCVHNANISYMTATRCVIVGSMRNIDVATDCKGSYSSNGEAGTLGRNVLIAGSVVRFNSLKEGGPAVSGIGVVSSKLVVDCYLDSYGGGAIELNWGAHCVYTRIIYRRSGEHCFSSSASHPGVTATDFLFLNKHETYGNLFGYSVMSFDLLLKHMYGSKGVLSYTILPGCQIFEFSYNTTFSYGCLTMLCGKNTARNSNFELVSGRWLFSQGRLYLLDANTTVRFTWPHKVRGVTSFRNLAPTINGNNTGNFSITYSINGGSFKSLTAANLSAESINNIESGFDLTIEVSSLSGSSVDYLRYVLIECLVDYIGYPYALNVVNITLQNVVDGSRYWVYNQNTGDLISSGLQSGSSDIVITNVPYNGINETLLIRVRKFGDAGSDYQPFETNATLTENGATVWISQQLNLLTN